MMYTKTIFFFLPISVLLLACGPQVTLEQRAEMQKATARLNSQLATQPLVNQGESRQPVQKHVSYPTIMESVQGKRKQQQAQPYQAPKAKSYKERNMNAVTEASRTRREVIKRDDMASLILNFKNNSAWGRLLYNLAASSEVGTREHEKFIKELRSEAINYDKMQREAKK